MQIPLKQMSMAEYAELETKFGATVVHRHGHHWRRVRPFFYRPLLPVEPLNDHRTHAPSDWSAGFQYAVSDGGLANSTMNFIMAENSGEYSLQGLSHNRRRLIKQAAKNFQVRPISDLQELKDQGYRAYHDFHNRTGYSYKSDRRNKNLFDEWAETLFQHPKTILLGGYVAEGLVAVSCSYWINSTLVYATLFSTTESLKKNVGELLFHELRRLAAAHSTIKEIYVRPYQGGNRMDQYYLMRGCRLVRQPAHLELPPLMSIFIRCLMPRKYAILCGEVSDTVPQLVPCVDASNLPHSVAGQFSNT
jgi:hypothetical protein